MKAEPLGNSEIFLEMILPRTLILVLEIIIVSDSNLEIGFWVEEGRGPDRWKLCFGNWSWARLCLLCPATSGGDAEQSSALS